MTDKCCSHCPTEAHCWHQEEPSYYATAPLEGHGPHAKDVKKLRTLTCCWCGTTKTEELPLSSCL